MIVRLFNDEGIWVPSVDIFLDVMKQGGLKLYDKDLYYEKIRSKLIEAEESPNPWTFNVRFMIEVDSTSGPVPCVVRIIKNQDVEKDGCSAIIVFITKSDISNNTDFDYSYTAKDMYHKKG